MTSSESDVGPRWTALLERARGLKQPVALLLAATAGVVIAALGDRWSGEYLRNVVDDALISLRYAQNLAVGNGLVFNPGERVEGYTNFLWTVLCTPVYWVTHAFGWNFVVGCVRLDLFIAGLNALMMYGIAQRLWQGRLLPLCAALAVLVVDNSFVVWAAMALESHLVSACMLATLLLWLSDLRRRGLWTGMALAAAVMARPDAALFALVFLPNTLAVILWHRFRHSGDAKTELRQWLWAAGAAAALYGIYFVWRYSYYGYLLPNTFYLKVGSSHFDAIARGKEYLESFVTDRGYLPLVALLSVLWSANTTVRTVLFWVLLHAGYVVYVGGDFYPGHRFLLVLIPFLGVLIGHVVFGLQDAARWLFSGKRWRPTWLRHAAGVALFFAVASAANRWRVLGLKNGPLNGEIRRWAHVLDENRSYMYWLRQRSSPDDWIVVGDIGSAGLYANLHVVDYYGVVDPEVAHQDAKTLGQGKPGHEKSASYAHCMSKKPKYIKWGYLPGIFWNAGYYLDTDIPEAFHQPGLWVRDELADTGRYLPATHIGFDPGAYPGWGANGDAFAKWPTAAAQGNQLPVIGTQGWFLSTFHPVKGDQATGILHSPELPLVGDLMVMRVAGGRDPEHLRVSLLIDGQIVASATGSNSEILGRRTFDISQHKGQQGTLEVVDDATGGWGHLIVDEIQQWQRTKPAK